MNLSILEFTIYLKIDSNQNQVVILWQLCDVVPTSIPTFMMFLLVDYYLDKLDDSEIKVVLYWSWKFVYFCSEFCM